MLSSPFTARARSALTAFHALIKGIADERHNLDLPDIIDLVIDRSGYGRWMSEQSDRGEERMDNIHEFREASRGFLRMGRDEALTAFLESVSLVADVDNFEQKTDAITLITLHQAKGLEFPIVFMVGMEEGLLPHTRSMDDPTQVEEERRLCYVGVTRAKERLYLLRAFRRGFRGGSEPGMPSRFLLDIPSELLEAPSQPKPATQRKSAGAAGWTGGAAASGGRRPTQTPTQGDAVGRAPTQNDVARRTPLTPQPDAGLTRRQWQAPIRSGRDAARKPGSASARRGTDSGADARRAQASAAPLSTGDKVRHKAFGEGIVTECKPSGGDYEVTVVFTDGAGIKRLLLGLAPLEKIQ